LPKCRDRDRARQAKNRQLEADAFEIRLRSEKRVGEMMAEQPKAPAGRKPKIGFSENPISLDDAGIDKNLANRALTYTLWKATTGTLNVAQQSIELARQEFLSTHRPKIRVKHVFLMNVSIINFEEPLIIRIGYVNYGSTPATIVSHGASIIVVRKGNELPPDWQIPNIVSGAVVRRGITLKLPDESTPIYGSGVDHFRAGQTLKPQMTKSAYQLVVDTWPREQARIEREERKIARRARNTPKKDSDQ
jgi:hypothetical protein